MPNSANVVPIIDTSASMTYNGYVPITVRDSSAFVSYASPGDGLGVVNYDTNGNVTYPYSVVDQNLTQAIAAAAAIQGLSFTGASTAIGNGLVTGKGMLDSQANPRGLVLLSDGYQNAGPDPLTVLPTGYPVYTCAMGPNANIQLMQQIAQRTGGSYYNAPYPSTMMFIFNQIRGQPTFVRTVANLISQIQVQGYVMVPAPISGSNARSQFGVVWDDGSLAYTQSANPTTTQISITLVNPGSPISGINPVIIGAGYVVFDIPNPQTGTWYVQVISGSNSATVQVTSGAFEFPTSQEAAALEVSVPPQLKTGQPLSFDAKVVEEGRVVPNLTVRADILRPIISVSAALSLYKSQWQTIELKDKDTAAGMPTDLAKLSMLRKQLLPSRDLLAHRSHPLLMKEVTSGAHTGRLDDTSQSGSYTIRVVAAGMSPVTKTAFQRTEIATVCVHD